MTVALEPQEHGVAAELEQAAAVFVRDQQDGFEAPADRLGDLFGALAPASCKALGETGEAGDVEQRRGAFGDPPSSVGSVDQMLLKNARYVQRQPLYAVVDDRLGRRIPDRIGALVMQEITIGIADHGLRWTSDR